MGKFINKRVVSRFPYQNGLERTVSLEGSRRVLQQIEIRVEGTADLAASGVTAKPGGIFNLLKNVSFNISGYDPAVDLVRSNENRLNIAGRYLGMTPGTTATPNDYARVNIALDPFTPIPAKSGLVQDIDPTDTSAQRFYFSAFLPFFVPRGLSPSDYLLDLANLQFAELRVQLGDLNDCLTTSNAGNAVSDCTVSIIVHEREELNLLEGSPNAVNPTAYWRCNQQTIPLTADSEEERIALNLNGNLAWLALVAYNSDSDNNDGDANDGDTDNFFIRNVRLERNGTLRYDLPIGAVRSDNIRTFPDMLQGASNGDHWLKGSGVFFVAPMFENANNRNHLTRAPYFGRADNSSQIVLSVKKPAAGNGEIVIIRNEVIPSVLLGAASKAVGDMSPAERQVSQAARTNDNAVSAAIQQAARANNVVI